MFAAFTQHLGAALVPLYVDPTHGTLLDGGVCLAARLGPGDGRGRGEEEGRGEGLKVESWSTDVERPNLFLAVCSVYALTAVPE